MALTDQEKADIVFKLGWPGKTLVEASTHYSSTVAKRMDGLTAPIEAQARALLARVKSADDALSCALSRMSTAKVGDIELRENESNLLRAERRKVLVELSQLLDIDIIASGGVNVSVIV